MSKQTENRQQKSDKTPVSPLTDAEKLRQKEEQKEVAGRHKNDGQKGHKGAR